MKEQKLENDYLQNASNHLQLLVSRLTEVAMITDTEIELMPVINDLVVMAHSLNNKVQENEQRIEFYVVGHDMVDLDTISALKNFLTKEVR